MKSRTGRLAALSIAGLFACASDGIAVHEYVLTSSAAPVAAAPTAGAAAGRAISVAVGPVVVPPYLRRREIVTRVGENELRASDTHRWGEELGPGLARVVAENLAAQIPDLRASAFAQRGGGAADYRVSIEVERFEAMPDGSVALEVRWELMRANTASPLAVRSASFAEESAGANSAAVVGAMSRAAARLSQEIARTLEENVAPVVAN
jgi:uncharacterized lipoprotein YmbA